MPNFFRFFTRVRISSIASRYTFGYGDGARLPDSNAICCRKQCEICVAKGTIDKDRPGKADKDNKITVFFKYLYIDFLIEIIYNIYAGRGG